MQVGDKVVIKDSIYCGPQFKPGSPGVIVGAVEEYFMVALDDGYLPATGDDGWLMLESELEAVE